MATQQYYTEYTGRTTTLKVTRFFNFVHNRYAYIRLNKTWILHLGLMEKSLWDGLLKTVICFKVVLGLKYR